MQAKKKHSLRETKERQLRHSVIYAALTLNFVVAGFFLWYLLGRQWLAPLDPAISQDGQFIALPTILSHLFDMLSSFAFALVVSAAGFSMMVCTSPLRGATLYGTAVLLGVFTALLAMLFAPGLDTDPSYWTRMGEGTAYLFPGTVYGLVIIVQFAVVIGTAVTVEMLGTRHGWVRTG